MEAAGEETAVPAVGMLFQSFSEVEKFINSYGESIRELFVLRRRSKLTPAYIKDNNEVLQYYQLAYCCKYGKKYGNKSEGHRQTSTYKVDCPAFISLYITADRRSLKITKTELTHEGHENSKHFYKFLPEKRRLAPEEREVAIEHLQLQCNKKLLRSKLEEVYGKSVTMKDLTNIKSKLRQEDDLTKMIKHLENKGATVKILTEDGRFKGLFFSTSDMRRSMNAWPEVVFIDGTYLLLRIGLTVMIFLVEDSNASSEIVGVALLAKEDYLTFKWLLQTFKDENSSACSRINCFMGDKDLLERDVIKEVFPGVPVYICLFHTLKIFSREITLDKMDERRVNKKREQRDSCLKILQKLAYSSSAQEYQRHYTEWQKVDPAEVLDYFKKNWHGNKEEWTCYSMTSGNLFNRTNNRLESLNAKIKQVVQKCSSLVDFADSFFEFIESHQHQVDLKTAKSFTRRRTVFYSADSAENKYSELLTQEALDYILIELKAHDEIRIDKQADFGCIIKADNLELDVTPSSCECGIARSSLLPCRHIFAVRKLFGLSLFSEDLCNERWTKAYCMKHQRSFQQLASTSANENVHKPPMLTNVSAIATSTATSRKKMLLSITNDLKNTCSQSCGAEFTSKLETIERVITSWEQNVDIFVRQNDEKRRESKNRQSVLKNTIRKKQTLLEKRKLIEPLTDKLIVLGLQRSGEDFKKRVDMLHVIETFWRQQLNVSIEEVRSGKESLPYQELTTDSRFVNASNQSSTSDDPTVIHQELVRRFELLLKPQPSQSVCDDELSNIEMPLAIKRKGRPSGCMNTWINIKKHPASKKKD